jgi:hypothetical protein
VNTDNFAAEPRDPAHFLIHATVSHLNKNIAAIPNRVAIFVGLIVLPQS